VFLDDISPKSARFIAHLSSSPVSTSPEVVEFEVPWLEDVIVKTEDDVIKQLVKLHEEAYNALGIGYKLSHGYFQEVFHYVWLYGQVAFQMEYGPQFMKRVGVALALFTLPLLLLTLPLHWQCDCF
jgi:hypothetical protein